MFHNLEIKKNCWLHYPFGHNWAIGDGRRFGMGAKPQGVWGSGVPPAGSRGRAPVGGLGTKSPEAEEFLK